jgi:hypothetical protein
MASRYEIGDDGHDQWDVAASLEHCNEKPRHFDLLAFLQQLGQIS